MNKVIDKNTFETVQNQLRFSSNKNIHKTSPLNSIRLDMQWSKKKQRLTEKDDIKESKFFLSRVEKKPRHAHKIKSEKKDNIEIGSQSTRQKIKKTKIELPLIKKLDLRNHQSIPAKENKTRNEEQIPSVNKINSTHFLSTRIQKEYYMSTEIKRLYKKLKEQKDKEYYRSVSYTHLTLPTILRV